MCSNTCFVVFLFSRFGLCLAVGFSFFSCRVPCDWWHTYGNSCGLLRRSRNDPFFYQLGTLSYHDNKTENVNKWTARPIDRSQAGMVRKLIFIAITTCASRDSYPALHPHRDTLQTLAARFSMSVCVFSLFSCGFRVNSLVCQITTRRGSSSNVRWGGRRRRKSRKTAKLISATRLSGGRTAESESETIRWQISFQWTSISFCF